jgi:hypothetical protein
MSRTLRLMHQKMESLRSGLLRFREGAEQQTVQVSTSVYDGQRLNCIFKDTDNGNPLLNREVVLIQKTGNDYFYITGRIDAEVKKICKVASLTITKACWFIRKEKGTVAWLQQKCVYESATEKMKNIA